MSRLLVWDLPVRLFHLLLGASFIGAFAIANLVDDETATFSVHMLLGLLMAFMVALRIIWGFVGTRHARFASFLHGPRAVLTYLGDIARRRGIRHAGHNPGTSVAIFLILILTLGLAVTGVMMGGGDEAPEDLHEIMAWALFVVVIGHVLGVIVHTVTQRENITRSMIDGRKEVAPRDAISGSRPLIALLFFALTALVGWQLAAGFDPATRVLDLPLIGASLQLGEVEEGDELEGDGSHERDHDDHDD